MTTATQIAVEHSKGRKEWVIRTAGTLTDDEAKAITFRADPGQVVLGAYVEVEDAEGIRIGHLSNATYHRQAFGPAYVICAIELM